MYHEPEHTCKTKSCTSMKERMIRKLVKMKRLLNTSSKWNKTLPPKISNYVLKDHEETLKVWGKVKESGIHFISGL